jgi:SAM-dependent methyltransferase
VNRLPVPFPPLELANRVGAIADQPNPFELYTGIGAGTREHLLKVLPEDWSFAGKRVLDFGCGAGRTLRHFLSEAETAEIWGCDIDEPSIDWLRDNLCPPFHVVTNGPTPPLAFEDSFFDLVYVISVFTHLTDSWSAWLLEMHRVLTDHGILIATFMGEGLCEIMSGEPWVEDRIGMNVYSHDQGWDKGGPMVLHSPWWIRAHWGRAFEIIDLQPYGFGHGFLDQGVSDQGVVIMRKRLGTFAGADIEALEPREPRERVALHHMIDVLQHEVGNLRAYVRSLQSAQG